jgi:hypothetical protein
MAHDKTTETLDWVESVLSKTDVRERIESLVTANATMTNSIVKQLTALRAQLRENAYSKIYEARAAVGDDLLKLTQSLTTLIHFSSVAGEDTTAYVSLLRSVSKVTQQLSFFGEADADGDGVKDDVAGEDPALDLQVDDGNPQPPEDAVMSPDKEVADDSATESPDVDPANVQPEDGDAGGEPAEDANPEDAGEDGQDAEMDEDGEVQTTDGDQYANEFDQVVKNLKNGKPAKQVPEDSQEGDSGEGEDTGEGEPAQEGDESAGEGEGEGEETDEDEAAKDGKKKGFLNSIGEGEGEDAEGEDANTAESAVATAAAESGFRFAYLGVCEDDKHICAIVGDKRYFYAPSDALFGGNVAKLDTAVRKLLNTAPGYTAVLQRLNSLVKAKKLKITQADKLSTSEIRDDVSTEIDRAQLGAVDVPAGTPWRYRGVGIQRVSNQDVCIWFEMGAKEYAAIPNPKILKPDEDIDGFSGRIHERLKLLSYDDGLTFLVGLIKRKAVKVIYAGRIP